MMMSADDDNVVEIQFPHSPELSELSNKRKASHEKWMLNKRLEADSKSEYNAIDLEFDNALNRDILNLEITLNEKNTIITESAAEQARLHEVIRVASTGTAVLTDRLKDLRRLYGKQNGKFSF